MIEAFQHSLEENLLFFKSLALLIEHFVAISVGVVSVRVTDNMQLLFTQRPLMRVHLLIQFGKALSD